MAYAFVNLFIASYPSQPKAIILDCDDSSAITHGDQQLSLFNPYYGDYCLCHCTFMKDLPVI